jgi:hypothetical protein
MNAAEATEIVEVQETAGGSAWSLVMSDGAMEKMLAAANIMASAKISLPKHLQQSPGDCMAIIMQSAQWRMNPFAVAQKTHVINGALGYEAQLVNAVVQQSGFIVGRFYYEYRGDGNSLECRVGAVIRGEQGVTWGEWLKSSDVTVKNSPLWKTNPKQQIGYLQVKNWSRAFCPGAILGVYTPEELQEREINPLPHRPQRQSGTQAAEAARKTANASVDLDERTALVARLEQIATEQGAVAYADAFANIGKAGRTTVGADEHARLKKLAADSDQAIRDAELAGINPETGEVEGHE